MFYTISVLHFFVFDWNMNHEKQLLITSGIVIIFASVGASVVILISKIHDSPIWGYLSLMFLIIFVVGFQSGMGL